MRTGRTAGPRSTAQSSGVDAGPEPEPERKRPSEKLFVSCHAGHGLFVRHTIPNQIICVPACLRLRLRLHLCRKCTRGKRSEVVSSQGGNSRQREENRYLHLSICYPVTSHTASSERGHRSFPPPRPLPLPLPRDRLTPEPKYHSCSYALPRPPSPLR